MSDVRISKDAGSSSPSGFFKLLPFANALLVVTALYSAGWCLFSFVDHKPQLYLKVVPAAVALVAVLALLLRPAAKILATSVFVGAAIGIYATELVALGLLDQGRSAGEAVRSAAKEDGVPYDARRKIEVIEDLRRKNLPAYPPFYPHLTFAAPLQIDGGPVIPLGSIAHVITVCCNEGGQYLEYTTDERGFANPSGLWSQAPIDVALVGASIAVGECVPAGDSIAGTLRARYPKTISLGGGGNGPFLELASVVEYLPLLKPRRVLWVFSESHTPDYLDRERHVPLLERYLDGSFSQNLANRQESIDRAVGAYLESAVQLELHPKQISLRQHAVDWASLRQVRTLVSGREVRAAAVDRARLQTSLYEQILRRGKQIVDGWGGQITILYVPDTSRYPGAFGYTPALRLVYDQTRAAVAATAAGLGIPVIDISRRFPDSPVSQASQYTQFFYNYPAHFKPAGYRLMDKAILEELQ